MYRVFRDIERQRRCASSPAAPAARWSTSSSMPRRYVENLVLDGLARIALSERALAK